MAFWGSKKQRVIGEPAHRPNPRMDSFRPPIRTGCVTHAAPCGVRVDGLPISRQPSIAPRHGVRVERLPISSNPSIAPPQRACRWAAETKTTKHRAPTRRARRKAAGARARPHSGFINRPPTCCAGTGACGSLSRTKTCHNQRAGVNSISPTRLRIRPMPWGCVVRADGLTKP